MFTRSLLFSWPDTTRWQRPGPIQRHTTKWKTTRRHSCGWKSAYTAYRARKLFPAPEQARRSEQPESSRHVTQMASTFWALSDRFWSSKKIKPGTCGNISLYNEGLCEWHRQNAKHKRKKPLPLTKSNNPQWLFCSLPQCYRWTSTVQSTKTKSRWIRGHLYSRLIPPHRKLWVRNSEGLTWRRQNYCWSPRWYTVWPPKS